MDILSTVSLESNSQIKINFDGGDLSSDAGLLLLKEFCHKIGAVKLVKRLFHTNDSAWHRIHKDDANLLQAIYQIFAAYFEDDCADELTNEPVMNAVLEKEALASQPTLSRFFNRMDETTLGQFNQILRELRKVVYSIKMPEFMLFDIDTSLLNAYGGQEGAAFNYHYQDNGYHPLFAFDGLTGDLMKAQLREGTQYCSRGAGDFMKSLLEEFKEDFPDIPLYLRGDSGFASPELYEALEEKDCKYAIRLKENRTLLKLAEDESQALYRATKLNQLDYAVEYGEFMYQAGSWGHPRRVVFKIEKPYGKLVHEYTFIVTTLEELAHWQVIGFYCGRGKMENFIKEGKSGFDFSAVSSSSMVVNANRLQVHVLAYNLFNWFRRLALAENMRKLRIDTIRLKLLKVAAKVVRSARYKYFKLCSSCPYKKEFYETLANIRALQPRQCW